MSKRATKRAKNALRYRVAEFDRIPVTRRSGYKQPGSLNPRKTHGYSR